MVMQNCSGLLNSLFPYKWLAIVNVGQYWGSGNVMLKLIESCLTFNSPFKVIFVFTELVQGSSILSKVLKKSSVIPSRA